MIGEIDLVRALGLAGIRSDVVSPPGDFTRYSRFARPAFDRIDAHSRPEEFVDLLVAFGRRHPEKPVLYYNGDWDLLMVSRFRERLGTAFRFVVGDAALLEDLVDKARFQELAAREGLPVAPALRLDPRTDPPRVDLRFPVVVKPLTREHATWRPLARAKVAEIASQAELESVWHKIAEAGIGVLVQELIPGTEDRIESYHAYVDGEGRLVAEFTGRKIRTYPTHHGYTTACEITDTRDTAELGRSIVMGLDLRGVSKLDFKRHAETGRLHLLEINPRFNLWHHPGARAGINIPALVYRDLMGLSRGPIPTARAGVRWCSPWRDVQAIRAEHGSLLRWLPWVVTVEAKCAMGWDDPLPFVGAVAYRALAQTRRRLRRRRA